MAPRQQVNISHKLVLRRLFIAIGEGTSALLRDSFCRIFGGGEQRVAALEWVTFTSVARTDSSTALRSIGHLVRVMYEQTPTHRKTERHEAV